MANKFFASLLICGIVNGCGSARSRTRGVGENDAPFGREFQDAIDPILAKTVLVDSSNDSESGRSPSVRLTRKDSGSFESAERNDLLYGSPSANGDKEIIRFQKNPKRTESDHSQK